MKRTLICASMLALWALGAEAQQTSFRFKGEVKDADGKGIAGVVVNNGERFTTTDGKGRWTLETDTTVSKFVQISTPADYVLPQTDGVADGFYVRVDELARKKGSHTFTLTRREKTSDSFCYIAISDPQVRSEKHLERWTTETVRDLKATTDSISRKREVVSVSLGDLVWDKMELFDDYKATFKGLSMTAFQCIGNHDFDLRYSALNNMPSGTPAYGEMQYHRHFGPTDYSFNIGKAHFITLKNINYMGGKKYKEGVTAAQLHWLKQDLSYVPKGSLVIVSMHASGWNTIENGGNVINAGALAEALKGYNVHVFVGHTHFAQNNEVSDSLYEHNIGAACGAWWNSWVNRCGAPNGYMIVDVDGSDLRWHYKPTLGSVSRQMKVYADGEFLSQPLSVVANVWDWDSQCRVEWAEDGVFKGTMEQFTDADEDYVATQKQRKGACVTGHLFRANPSDQAQQVTVIFTNRWGEKFTETIEVGRKYREVVRGGHHPRIIAHRGHWTVEGAAQNGLVALREAAAAGVYGSEFDVQMTKDGVPVVCHDPVEGGVSIADRTYEQLKRTRLANGESLPLLSDFLDEGKKLPHVKLILEIKSQPTAEADSILTEKVVEMVNAKGLQSQVEYLAFGLKICEQVARLAPSSHISYLRGDIAPADLKAKGITDIDYNAKVFILHPEWIGQAHALGMTVNIWTPGTLRELTSVIALRPDFITTDHPVEAMKLAKGE